MTYTIVTGAAGFIGANLVAALNARGITNIIAVDSLKQRTDKFRNLVDCEIADYVDKNDFLRMVEAGYYDGAVEAVLHQGACSDTMETDGAYMMENNYRYSLALLDWCQEQEVPLLYASSAAVYGGSQRFVEERALESPINVYGYSKFLFDQIVRRRIVSNELSAPVTGLRYFNVYGPREQHKGRMASVAFHNYQEFQQSGKVRLFGGWDGYADGCQQRDFIYVGDAVKVNLHFLDSGISGIYNCGSGRAQPFNDVAVAAANACRQARGEATLALAQMAAQGLIEYIPFPDALKGKYQNHTQADLTNLRQTGYEDKFLTVDEGVAQYLGGLLR